MDGHDFDAVSEEFLRARASSKWSALDQQLLPAWVAEMDFPIAPVVRNALADALQREEVGYALSDKANGLAGACARFQTDRYGWAIDENHVHVIADVLRGIEVAIRGFVEQHRSIIVTTPSYPPFFQLGKATGRDVVEVPMTDDDSFDIEAIDKAFHHGAGVLVLCHPYNPLGRSFSVDELRAIGAVVSAHDGIVIADEIHAPLTYAPTSHVPYASISTEHASHCLTLVSATKAFNFAGLKCAQMIITDEVLNARWSELPSLWTHGASTFGIRASIAAYKDGAAWLSSTNDYLRANRDHLAKLVASELPGVRFRAPQATYLAWLDCRDLGLDAEPGEFFEQQAQVALNKGPSFGEVGRGFVRLNFATPTPILERVVRQMSEALTAVGLA